jgi:hypothetical protein
MRGARQSAHKAQPSEAQSKLRALARGRRSKIAAAASTTLVKVDQWARGEAVAPEVAKAIEAALSAPKKKKS